jgi:uncharacterized membrane protein
MLGLALLVGLWPLAGMVHERFFLGLGPWMLVGLVPLFLGLAMLIVHYLLRERASSARTPKRGRPTRTDGPVRRRPASLPGPGIFRDRARRRRSPVGAASSAI